MSWDERGREKEGIWRGRLIREDRKGWGEEAPWKKDCGFKFGHEFYLIPFFLLVLELFHIPIKKGWIVSN